VSIPTIETVERGSDRAFAPSHELPLGAIRARGWLLDQLRLQATGLTGHLEEVWEDVGPDSGWKGGPGEDWERGPYYLDGLVPLAHLLQDEGLTARIEPWIEWMLSSQDATGFFGPAGNRDWWPRMVALKVLTQHADATGDDRVEPFLAAYFRHQLAELPRRPLTSWGRVRGADNILSVWWLHDRTGEDWLLELVDLLQAQTEDWDAYLTTDLITGPSRYFRHIDHGPNVAMGLKTGAVAALRDGDADHRKRTERSLAALDRWHGQAHGWFSGDEWLGGREATAGIETCQVVELMYTFEQFARIYGDGSYGDRLESLAFNLLPAACDPRMLAHQYHQQANQVLVSVGQRPWTHSSDDANIFGLEPHFGCCTANYHQGWPKFVRSLWLADADGALRAVSYAPCAVTTTVGGAPVRLTVETSYPFEETVTITVGVDGPTQAALRLRIPDWASEPRLTVAGDPQTATRVNGHVTIEREWTDGEVIQLVLPMALRAVRRERQAVSLRLGPLVMALEIPENWIPVPNAPGLGEWEVHPRKSWNYGLTDPGGLPSAPIERRPPGPVPWELSSAPVRIETRGAHVHGWRLDGAQAGLVPPSPVFDAGPEVNIRLVPYGSARLRVVEFPVIGKRVEPDGH
jgi:hypothetical protein